MASVAQWTVDELHRQLEERGPRLQVVDVRRPAEYEAGRIPGALNLPLLAANLKALVAGERSRRAHQFQV